MEVCQTVQKHVPCHRPASRWSVVVLRQLISANEAGDTTVSDVSANPRVRLQFMGDFFRGWRRKVGCALLILACVFAAGWVRSYSDPDQIRLQSRMSYVEGNVLRSVSLYVELNEGSIQGVRRTTRYFGSGTGVSESSVLWSVPYWSIVDPLTLLSAWLLLSKPRKRIPKSPQLAVAIGS